MRSLAGLRSLQEGTAYSNLVTIVICASICVSSPVLADPKPASGYSVEVVSKPGAVFAGLARDGNVLLVTDLSGGRLYRRAADGQFLAFGPTLPHGVDVIGDPTGPYQIARYGSNYLVTEGWTPKGHDESPYDHALLEVDDSKVVRVIHNDFLNPFDFVVSADTLYVVDAAQNSIERLNTDGSGKSTLFSFARLSQPESALKRLSPTEFSGQGKYELDAVPTGIAAQGSRLYVSLFGGFPFIAGSGRVVSLSNAVGAPTIRIEAGDLNSPVDVAFGMDGRMLVLEHGIYNEAGGFLSGSGRLLSIDSASGERQVLVDGLTRPAAVLVFDEREIIVSELGGRLIFLKRKA